MRTKPLLIVSAAALAIALPAVAQQLAQTQPQPAANQYPNGGIGATQPRPQTQPSTAPSSAGDDLSGGADETGVDEVNSANLQPTQPVQPPTEYPGWARRDPWVVGKLDPAAEGLGDSPWGDASGAFLTTLMRRMNTPLASRWAHIALRDA
jgi:hypothetical protein